MADIDELNLRVTALEAELEPLRSRLDTLRIDCIQAFADWLGESIRTRVRQSVIEEADVTKNLEQQGILKGLKARVEQLASESYRIAHDILLTDRLWVHVRPEDHQSPNPTLDYVHRSSGRERTLGITFKRPLERMGTEYESLMSQAKFDRGYLHLSSTPAPEKVWSALEAYADAVPAFLEAWRRVRTKQRERDEATAAEAWDNA